MSIAVKRENLLCVYTSFIFSTTCLHSVYTGELLNAFIFFWISQLSILNHCTCNTKFIGKDLFLYTDKTLTGLGVLHCVYKAVIYSFEYNSFIPISVNIVSVFWILYVYLFAKLSWLPGDNWKPWHGSLHLAAGIANHIILYYGNSKGKLHPPICYKFW